MIHCTKKFLDHETAENLYSNLQTCPETWWIKSRVIMGQPSVLSDNTLASMSRDWEVDITDSLRKNMFTYSFSRTTEHYDSCNCFMCSFKHYVSYVFKDHIEKHTDLVDLELNESFFSLYNQGDFLSTHHDENKGDVAFVLNLTKNWRPEYGGLFHMNNNYITPEFNSLMFFELGEKGEDHFVSEVSHRAPHPRLAFSGWFRKSK